MIQRIQSIFLFLASGAAFGLFGLPFAKTDSAVAQSTIFSDGLYTISDNIALLILFAAAGVLSFGAIFLFKNRKTQMIIGRISLVANVIGLILAVILFMQDRDTLGVENPSDGFGLYLPFLFLVFGILAQRAINKDEKLVSGMDRLR